MTTSPYVPATPEQLEREARDWDEGTLRPGDWKDAPEAPPSVGETTLISLRMPKTSLALLRAFAAREGVGYQVLMKRWLDERIRDERTKVLQMGSAQLGAIGPAERV